jgi:hypothetical protein
MDKEKNENKIRIPTTFTVSMTKTEALNRIRVAKQVDGIKFKMLGLNEQDRIIGQTVVTSMEGLDNFNNLLKNQK